MEEFEKELKKTNVDIKKSKLTAYIILKKYIKPVYENIGKEWTKENDEDMIFLVNAMGNVAGGESIITTSKVLVEVFESNDKK